MGKSGIMLKLADGRTVVCYNEQPLLSFKRKIILNLIDENYNLILDEKGKSKIIIKELAVYNAENEKGENKLIGYVD